MAIILDMTRSHVPVLAGELIDLAAPAPGENVVDCTFGGGGHARLLAERIGPAGTLVCVDRDPAAEERFEELAAEVACATRFLRMDYVEALAILGDEGFGADLVLFDLGVSSMQIDTRERGFSYSYDAPLDMRMDPTVGPDARDVVNGLEERQLAKVLAGFGEEPNARAIAREIARRRERAPLETTGELVAAVEAALPAAVRRRFGGSSPAKRVFQAIRIAVNHELEDLDQALPEAWAHPAARRPVGGHLVPLAGGQAREAVPGRSRPGLHLPARLPRVRLRAHPRGGAAHPQGRGSDAGRGRPQPALGVRAHEDRPPRAGRRGLMAAIPARAPSRRAPSRAPARRPAPRRRTVAPAPARGRGARVLDRLLQGQVWVGLIFVLLAGIVFLNVSLLGMNRSITHTADRAATVKRENARLRTELARLGSSERIQRVAAQAGLVFPKPGEVRYLTARPAADARSAAKRLAAGELATPVVAPVIPPAIADPVVAPENAAGPEDLVEPQTGAETAPEAPAAAPVEPQVTAAARDAPGSRHPGGPVGVRLVDRRIGLLFAVFMLLLGLACTRATWLGTVRADSLGERAATQQVEDFDVAARRGTITDRRGVELAVSEDAVTVFANPMLVKDKTGTAARLAPLVGRSEDDLLKALSGRGGFVYLRRKLDPDLGERVAKLGIEGIDTVTEPRRTYPQGALAGQLIGAVGTDNLGLSGVEQQYEEQLHGSDGRRRLVKDATGEPVSIIDERRAEAGEDLRLTIDAALQERVEAVMGEVGRANRPRAATALVMDPRTGELLALSNWPRVDSNDIGAAPSYARQNRAVGASYEPGSTFKAFTVAGALEEGLIKPSTAFDLPPEIQVADRRIGEAHDRGSVRLSVAEILAQSSNVGSVMIGLKMGPTRFDRWVRQVRVREPDRGRAPGRGRRDRAPAQGLLRLLAGQPADRPGAGGHPDPDGHRLLGTGQRRRDARPARGRGRGRARPACDLRPHREPDLADAGGRARGRRHRGGGAGARLRAGGQDGHGREARSQARRVLQVQVLLLLPRLRARAQAAAAGGGHGRRAQGRALGSGGGRSGLREDRGVRPALHAHPAPLTARARI